MNDRIRLTNDNIRVMKVFLLCVNCCQLSVVWVTGFGLPSFVVAVTVTKALILENALRFVFVNNSDGFRVSGFLLATF